MRKSIITTQVTILVLCGSAVLINGMRVLPMLAFLVTMELGALVGIWWSRRLRARAQSAPLR